MNKASKRKKFIEIAIVLCLSLGVSVKMLFTGFGADEEYQLVLAYRLASGDHLFREIWDTIQTSGFVSAALLKGYMTVRGSTEGSMVFLRICGELMQAMVAVYLYRTLRRRIAHTYAFLISVCYFVTYIKMIAMPDFSMLYSWALMLTICFVWRAYDGYLAYDRLSVFGYLVLAGLAVCVSVLAVANVVIFPIICVFIGLFGKKGRLFRILTFAGTCIGVGLLYIINILRFVSFDALLNNLSNILSGDDTHMTGTNLLGNSKWLGYGENLLVYIAYFAIVYGLARLFVYLIGKQKKQAEEKDTCLYTFATMTGISILISLFQWVILGQGYDSVKLYIPVLVVAGIYFAHGLRGDGLIPYMGILLAILSFLHVLFISNVTLFNNIAFLAPGAICGMILLALRFGNTEQEIQASVTRGLLIGVTLVSVFGTGYTFLSGPAGNNIFDITGIVKTGPAKWLLTTKDIAYVYYNDYNVFAGLVAEETPVLIVTDYFRNTSVTSCYMVNHLEISHYSVNSTPTYSAKLLEYWDLYPEKKPQVIVVNTTAVTLGEQDWIYRYIHEEFGYTDVVTTDIAEYYIK